MCTDIFPCETDFLNGVCRMLVFVCGTCYMLLFLFVELVNCLFSPPKTNLVQRASCMLIFFVELVGCWCLLVKLVACWSLSAWNLHIDFSPRDIDFVHVTFCLLIFVLWTCCMVFFSWNLLHVDFSLCETFTLFFSSWNWFCSWDLLCPY